MIPVFRRLWPFISAYKGPLLLGVVCMVLMDVFAYAIPIVVGYVTDHVYPRIAEPGMVGHLALVVGILLLVGVVRGFVVNGMIRGYWFMAESTVRDIRNAVYEKLQHLDLSFYDRARTGDLMSRVSYDIQLIRNFLAFGVEHRVRIILISATIFVLMVLRNWRLALAIYTILPVFFGVIIYFSNRMRRAVEVKQRQMGQLNARLQENVTGIRVVKAFAQEEAEIRRFDTENDQMYRRDLAVGLLQVHLNAILLLTDGVGSLIILLYGGYNVIQGAMSMGTLFAFVAYLGVMAFPIRILAFNTSLISLARGGIRRVQEILDSPDQHRHNTGTCTEPIQGHLRFDSVSFRYESDAPVLQNVSFDVQAGERVALFGLTGAGKSTIISLIPRFYLPDSGAIEIDGRDIRDWNLQHLRAQIGTVLQETFLFSATIRENISFGRSDATFEEITQAARHAHIHEFIESLPDGYETIVGEYGVGLSGGQRQRVAIARTLLQDPRLLILDDCTSSLDAVTERRIQEQLRELMEGRTTIIVAQRMSTLRLADRIIVVDRGTVADADSHDKLLQRNALYRNTYTLQTAFPASPIDESTR
jgi:ATP-binding cassette subfamily B protein